MKRILYFIYYIKQLDFRKFTKFLDFAAKTSKQSKTTILLDVIMSVFKYNISILDYFYFRFYNKDKIERLKWAGTGYLFEFQLYMNPKGSRDVLENKIRFLNRYKAYVKRSFADLTDLKTDENAALKLLNNPSKRMVLKGSHGQVGAEVEVINCEKFTYQGLIDYMETNNYDLAEEYVVQHPALMELSQSGLNTIRVFTQSHNGNVDIIGARLRISVNSPIDNMAAGNLAAPIDLQSGLVSGPAVYSDITKNEERIHPVTGKAIEGFKVPFWEEAKQMSIQAALLSIENRSIGWDIAISEQGPELIEGNHNWCKLLWQLPVKQGLKPMLQKYISEKR